MAAVRLRGDGCLLFGLAVLPAWRGAGTGGRLVAGCLAWAAVRGAGHALADVEGDPPPSWRRWGFGAASSWRRYTSGRRR